MTADAHKFRVVYVLAHEGEVGPCRVEDLAGHLDQGRIALTDQVRSAFGARVGTVDDIISGRVRVGSNAVSAQWEDDDAGSGTRPRVPAGALALTAVVVLALLGLAWGLLRPAAAGVAAPVDSGLPLVLLMRGEDSAQGALVRVMMDRRMPVPVTIRTRLSGDEGRVRLEPANGEVTIPPGDTFAHLALVRAGSAYQPRTVALTIEGGATYTTADKATLAVTIAAAAIPLIAWESFAPAGAVAVQGSGGLAWNAGGVLQAKPERMAVTGTAPGYHSLLQSKDPQWLPIAGRLPQTIERGPVWISYCFAALPRPDGKIPWTGVSLRQGQQNVLGIGAWRDAPGSGMLLRLFASQPRHEDEVADTRTLTTTGARVVIHLELGQDAASAQAWIDPPAGVEPRLEACLLNLPRFPACRFDGVELAAMNGAGLQIADLRIGRSWQEAMPAD